MSFFSRIFGARRVSTASDRGHGNDSSERLDIDFERAFTAGFEKIAEYIGRIVKPTEKAAIAGSVLYALKAVSRFPSYAYPNVLGRASSILAFTIITYRYEEYGLHELRSNIGLSQDDAEQHLDWARGKLDPPEWRSSPARSVIIGTRFTLYTLVGMDGEGFCQSHTLFDRLAKQYYRVVDGEPFQEETKKLFIGMVKESEDRVNFGYLLSLS